MFISVASVFICMHQIGNSTFVIKIVFSARSKAMKYDELGWANLSKFILNQHGHYYVLGIYEMMNYKHSAKSFFLYLISSFVILTQHMTKRRQYIMQTAWAL